MLSKILQNSIYSFMEEAEKLEKSLIDKDKIIQRIVTKCELALIHKDLMALEEIIEEYKNEI